MSRFYVAYPLDAHPGAVYVVPCFGPDDSRRSWVDPYR